MSSDSSISIRVSDELRVLDTKLREAGLARSRGPAARQSNRTPRFAPASPEELDRLRPESAEPAIASNGVQWLAASGWKRLGWLWHGFSTRRGGLSRAYRQDGAQGELNLGFTSEDDRDTVIANRRRLAEAITGCADTPLVTVRQIHSKLVVRAGRQAAAAKPARADGLMTDEPGILLAVMTADCIPVLVVDRKCKAVAAFHAGWRGTVQRIVESGIGRMQLEFGSRPEDLTAAIGPGIGTCCYSVGDEVLAEFESQFEYGRGLFVEVDETDPVRRRYPTMFLNQRAPGHGPKETRLHVNLVEANRRQLLAAGLQPRSIRIVPGCTGCRADLFFSHRASGGRAGRMMSVIGIGPER